MPAFATALTSSSTRTTLSISEYSVCRRRWTNSDIQRLESDLHRAERFAMQRRGFPAAQRGQMVGRAVALVIGELEAGITHIQLLHHGVATGFGENGGGADGAQLGVAFNDRFDRAAEVQVLDARKLIA